MLITSASQIQCTQFDGQICLFPIAALNVPLINVSWQSLYALSKWSKTLVTERLGLNIREEYSILGVPIQILSMP